MGLRINRALGQAFVDPFVTSEYLMRYCVACGGDPYSEHISYWCDDGDPENRLELNSTLIAVGLESVDVCEKMSSSVCSFLCYWLLAFGQPSVHAFLVLFVIISQSPYHRFGSAPCEYFLLPASNGRTSWMRVHHHLPSAIPVCCCSPPHLHNRQRLYMTPTSWIGDTCSQPLPRTLNSTSYGIGRTRSLPPLLAMLETHDTPRKHRISELLGKRSSRIRPRET
ncbi:hypothetical protein B0T13DRAFT_124831 [Neurospora crassa]|nr:hypothetical protein B0T13DRAFT_124831 [Neurospora crassa]